MNFQSINEKIIDDQGNVKTFSSGQDARLYYLNFAGERLKYLLEGEGMEERLTDKFELQRNIFFKCTEKLTEISYTFQHLNNGLIVFSTGETINYEFTYPASMYINKVIELLPNRDYVIVIENSLIFWTEVTII